MSGHLDVTSPAGRAARNFGEVDGAPAPLDPADSGQAEGATARVARAIRDILHDSDDPPSEMRFDGAFRLEERIGVGGMGVVYAATTERPRRRVAVKLLRPELATLDAMRRLRFEAEVLARLDHPNVARVLAFGIAEGELGDCPYLVTELVVGADTITAFAERHALDLRARVSLVQSAIEAVAHGHEKGVIHRDLKPGNVLVDERGVVKVIDFGLAKVASPDLSQTTLPSDRTGWIGTIDYLAPELLRGSVALGDTRSDVYALGILLVEILIGHHPYGKRVAAGPAASLASTASLVAGGVVGRAIAAHRHRLGRDLARILGRATAEEPSRRYSSAADLAADLGRWLRGERPLAAGPSRLTPIVALIRRRWQVAAIGILAAGVAIAIPSLHYLRQERGSALHSAAKERHGRLVAAAVQAFNSDQFGAVPSHLESAELDSDRWEVGLLRAVPSGAHTAIRLPSAIQSLSFVGETGWLLVGTADDRLRFLDSRGSLAEWSLELCSMARRVDTDELGHYAVVALASGRSMIVDLTDTRRSRSFETEAIAISKDGRLIALASGRSSAICTVDARPLFGALMRNFLIESSRWSPFGDQLGLIVRERDCAIWESTSPGVVNGFMNRFGPALDLWWLDDPDHRLVLTATNGPIVWRHGSTSGLNPALRAGGAEVIAVSRCGRLVAFGTGTGRVGFGDYERGQPLLDVTGHRGAVSAIAISSDSRRIASAGADGYIRLWDLPETGPAPRPDAPIMLGYPGRLAQVSERLPLVTMAVEEGRVAIFDFEARRFKDIWAVPNRDATALSVSACATRSAVGFASGEVWCRVGEGGPFLVGAEGGQVCGLTWLDDRRLAILWDTGELRVVDVEGPVPLWRIDLGHVGARVSLAQRRLHARPISGGDLELTVLVAGDDCDVARICCDDGRVLGQVGGRRLGVLHDRAAGMAIDGETGEVLVVSARGQGYRWLPDAAPIPFEIEPPPPPIAALELTSDPERFLVVSRTGVVTAVDRSTSRHVATIHPLLRTMAGVGVTTHRDSLVLVGMDGAIRVLPTR